MITGRSEGVVAVDDDDVDDVDVDDDDVDDVDVDEVDVDDGMKEVRRGIQVPSGDNSCIVWFFSDILSSRASSSSKNIITYSLSRTR